MSYPQKNPLATFIDKGSWTTVEPKNPSVYHSLTKPSLGAGAVCGRKAFLVGGMADHVTDDSVDSKDPIPIPGMVVLDMDSKEWSNQSLASMAPPYGSFISGKATCVTGFKQNGFVLTVGGKTTSPSYTDKGEAVSMSNLTFYDVDNDRWLWQETTGSTPAGRWDHCAVGVESPDGTFEM